MEEKKTKDYYIAYFDILGYKAYFDDNENDIQELLRNNIAIARDAESMANRKNITSQTIFYKMFSDNCIILLDGNDVTEKVAIKSLTNLVAALQLKILKDYGIPIRGGITRGQVYIDDEIVFGSGLIDAVKLEDKIAQYPRIVIDEERFSKGLFDVIDAPVKLDNDGKYYIDFYSLLTVGSIFFPKPEEKSNVCKVRDQVFNLIKKYGAYDKRISSDEKIKQREKIIYKYLWLLLKYNEFVEANKLPVKIQYNISVNKKLVRFEITDVIKNPWPVFCN